MSSISRRVFLKDAATTAAAAGLLSASPFEFRANPLGLPIGCQTWPVRDGIVKGLSRHDQTARRGWFSKHRTVLARGLRRFRLWRPR